MSRLVFINSRVLQKERGRDRYVKEHTVVAEGGVIRDEVGRSNLAVNCSSRVWVELGLAAGGRTDVARRRGVGEIGEEEEAGQR
jgi:hypothetical protein